MTENNALDVASIDDDWRDDVVAETCDACQLISGRQGTRCDHQTDRNQCPTIQAAVSETESEMMLEAYALGENCGRE